MKSDRSSDFMLNMSPLQRALIEKAGHDNGFEYVLPGDMGHVALASARHQVRVRVAVRGQGFEAYIDSGSATLVQELGRAFVESAPGAASFALQSDAMLARWLRQAAALSQTLPNQAVAAFEQQVQAELAELSPPTLQSTEVSRMVRQRVGQQAYRQAMLDYWGGACALTGLTLTPLLRASHAKPWAVCDSDMERLDVFNVNGWPWHLEQIRPLSQHRVHANHRGHLCSKIQKPPDTRARAFTALTAPHSRPNWSPPASSLVLPLPHWPWLMG